MRGHGCAIRVWGTPVTLPSMLGPRARAPDPSPSRACSYTSINPSVLYTLLLSFTALAVLASRSSCRHFALHPLFTALAVPALTSTLSCTHYLQHLRLQRLQARRPAQRVHVCTALTCLALAGTSSCSYSLQRLRFLRLQARRPAPICCSTSDLIGKLRCAGQQENPNAEQGEVMMYTVAYATYVCNVMLCYVMLC